MPTYEYACGQCSHEWETEQSIKEAPLTDCPSCHAKAAKRQISKGAGFILKGGGWYSDLYSSSGNKKADAASSTAGGSAKAETKAETKSGDGSGSKPDSGGGGASSGGSTSGGSSDSGGSSSGGSSSSGASASAA